MSHVYFRAKLIHIMLLFIIISSNSDKRNTQSKIVITCDEVCDFNTQENPLKRYLLSKRTTVRPS